MLRLPGLIDVHTHMRTPGQTHKEDFNTGTSAALAGGYTTILSMPNTNPPLTNAGNLALGQQEARATARCDYGFYAAGSNDNFDTVASIAPQVAGLKLFLDSTFGTLLLSDGRNIEAHVRNWPADRIILAHSEGAGSRSLGFLLYLAFVYQRKIHICHVATRDEILLIRAAKEKGLPITCETGVQYLLFTQEDERRIGPGFFEVRPRIGTSLDRAALWENLEFIDIIANDHAPHTIPEKQGLPGQEPMPGQPGLETALSLLLGLVREGKLTIEDLIKRLYTNPKKIFGLPEQNDTYIDVDEDETWVVRASELNAKCKWSPYEGMRLQGRVKRVVLRGRTAFENGEVLAPMGTGRDVAPAFLEGYLIR
jgi:carbamoyl-phosphate synthase / aspartate carbamoyltransferase / dihydroorotase